MLAEDVWPYILPFPLDVEKRRLVWSILQSRVGMSILTHIKLDGRTYQHNLIQKLPYSNKSVIEYLKTMVSAEILEQGMEQIVEKERKTWMKWYMPTQLGKWFILFLKPPAEISTELTKKAVAELFQVYSKSIVDACKKYGISIDSFHDVLDEQYLQETVKKELKTKPDVVVFGSAALDIYGRIKKLPQPEETMYVEEIGRCPGGMGANVATALAKLQVPVAFIGKIGSDSTGRLLLESLQKNNVDVSSLSVGKLASLQTLILTNKGARWLFAIGSKTSALSITSPNEINWNLIKNCKIVYVGEVFVEIASTIANFAKTQQKTVIYRPGIPYLKFGMENLSDILEHIDIFILNNLGWKILQESSQKKLETPLSLLQHGPKTIIVTEGVEGCETYTATEKFTTPIPQKLLSQFKVVDPTGAGDAFAAGLIKGLLNGWNLKKAITYGQDVAAIKCSRIGTSPAFPTLKEVENIFQTSGRNRI